MTERLEPGRGGAEPIPMALARRLEAALAPLHEAGSLQALIKSGPPDEISRTITALKEALETQLQEDPEDYWTLVTLGELDLRIGLLNDAQALLYHASLQRPPSWEDYQRLTFLLRRAEEQQQYAVYRPAGAPPPLFLRRAVQKVAAKLARAFKAPGISGWS